MDLVKNIFSSTIQECSIEKTQTPSKCELYKYFNFKKLLAYIFKGIFLCCQLNMGFFNNIFSSTINQRGQLKKCFMAPSKRSFFFKEYIFNEPSTCYILKHSFFNLPSKWIFSEFIFQGCIVFIEKILRRHLNVNF